MADRDAIRVRTEELMAEHGLPWRKAWRQAEAELGRAEGPKRSPRRGFVAASVVTAVTIVLLGLVLASSDPSDPDYENAGMVIGVLGLAVVPLFVWWLIALIRMIRHKPSDA